MVFENYVVIRDGKKFSTEATLDAAKQEAIKWAKLGHFSEVCLKIFTAEMITPKPELVTWELKQDSK